MNVLLQGSGVLCTIIQRRVAKLDESGAKASGDILSVRTLLQCCGSKMFIPDPDFSILDPGSRIQDIGYRLCNTAGLLLCLDPGKNFLWIQEELSSFIKKKKYVCTGYSLWSAKSMSWSLKFLHGVRIFKFFCCFSSGWRS